MSREPAQPCAVVAVDVKLHGLAIFARVLIRDADGNLFNGRLGSTFWFDFDPGDELEDGYTRVDLEEGAEDMEEAR